MVKGRQKISVSTQRRLQHVFKGDSYYLIYQSLWSFIFLIFKYVNLKEFKFSFEPPCIFSSINFCHLFYILPSRLFPIQLCCKILFLHRNQCRKMKNKNVTKNFLFSRRHLPSSRFLRSFYHQTRSRFCSSSPFRNQTTPSWPLRFQPHTKTSLEQTKSLPDPRHRSNMAIQQFFVGFRRKNFYTAKVTKYFEHLVYIRVLSRSVVWFGFGSIPQEAKSIKKFCGNFRSATFCPKGRNFSSTCCSSKQYESRYKRRCHSTQPRTEI